VTEVRAGVYVLGDVFQASIGSCALEDIAASVLTTVIGNHPERGQLVVDAGGLALSKDVSTRALGEDGDCGYGLVVDALTGKPIDGLYVHGVSQEHGILRSRGTIDHAQFPIGRRLRVLPNHSCMTAAAYDSYHVLGEDGAIEAVWPRVNGW
jgi:D-serine deaminase-like pyridoxal phosphate-dependent protein